MQALKSESILFSEVTRTHEQLYKPEQSRFSKESKRYWKALFPDRATKIGKFAIWLESHRVSEELPRQYSVKIINLDNGKINTCDHYTMPDCQEALTTDKKEAEKHFLIVKNYLLNNGKVNH